MSTEPGTDQTTTPRKKNQWNTWKGAGIFFGVFLVVLGVWSLFISGGDSQPGGHGITYVAPYAAPAPDPSIVSHAQFGHRWPLTVSHGEVNCIHLARNVDVLTFYAPNGLVYALNGVAAAKTPEAANIRHIWADDPTIPGLKKDITPLTNRALRTC